ncbi:uncharacterized protein A4U43_C04F5520 [Asparagus officinalis]|uniref:Enoyl-CoA hydratase/isomerase family protein n=1 Tax=Asparagus officinalis TaxID=4686 RepID=A0A5P1F2Z4_ASPOF|nr:uncharacterized protein A4U43_C04F5520 [Asparagus officinalis]
MPIALERGGEIERLGFDRLRERGRNRRGRRRRIHRCRRFFRRDRGREIEGVGPVLDDGEVEAVEECDLDDDDEADEERDREIRPSPPSLPLLRGGAHRIRVRPKVGFISIDIITNMLEGARKPSVAAIDGVALGGGLEVAMACHASISTSTAQLGLPELQLEIIPGFRDAFSLNGHESASVSSKSSMKFKMNLRKLLSLL